MRQIGEFVRAHLAATFENHPHVADIRGRGPFIGLELVADREANEPFEPSARIAGRIKGLGMEEGLVCHPSARSVDGVRGDHVLLAPSFIISEDEVVEAVARLTRAIDRAISAGTS